MLAPTNIRYAAIPVLYITAWATYHWLIWPDSASYVSRLPLLIVPLVACVLASGLIVHLWLAAPRRTRPSATQAIIRGLLTVALTLISGGLVVLLDIVMTYGGFGV